MELNSSFVRVVESPAPTHTAAVSNVQRFLVLFGLLLIFPGSAARGAVVVDQSFIGLNAPTGFALADGFAYIGQTVTAGVTGQLLAVELNVGRRSDFLVPWVVDIQQVVAGAPTGVVLSSTTIAPENFPVLPVNHPPNIPLPLSVAMNVGIPLQAGDQFAIVIHPEGITGNPGFNAGLWGGDNGYAGGTALTGFSGTSLAPYEGDAPFRTYMLVVPEPASAAMLAVATICGIYSRRGRRNKRQHRLTGWPCGVVRRVKAGVDVVRLYFTATTYLL